MCTSTPKMPAVTPVEAPPMQQDEKAPDMSSQRKKNPANSSQVAGGTLLTGPSGITGTQTGSTTLLGA